MLPKHFAKHNYDASSTLNMLMMRSQLAMEGVGIYWCLFEQLLSNGGTMPLKLIPFLAIQMGTTADKVKAVVTNYELFLVTEDSFSLPEVTEHLQLMQAYVEKGREGANKRWQKLKQLQDSPPINLTNSPPNCGGYTPPNADKIKEDKNKKKEDNTANTPTGGSVNDEEEISFEKFWVLYDKKVGDRKKLLAKWKRLSNTDREKIFIHVPKYKEARPDKTFRKDPQTYLNNGAWNDEIIINNNANTNATNSIGILMQIAKGGTL